MSNKVKDIDIKNCTCYFFNDPNNIKIGEKSYKNILIYYVGHVMIKELKNLKINSVNHVYLITSKVDGYFEEINGKSI